MKPLCRGVDINSGEQGKGDPSAASKNVDLVSLLVKCRLVTTLSLAFLVDGQATSLGKVDFGGGDVVG